MPGGSDAAIFDFAFSCCRGRHDRNVGASAKLPVVREFRRRRRRELRVLDLRTVHGNLARQRRVLHAKQYVCAAPRRGACSARDAQASYARRFLTVFCDAPVRDNFNMIWYDKLSALGEGCGEQRCTFEADCWSGREHRSVPLCMSSDPRDRCKFCLHL